MSRQIKLNVCAKNDRQTIKLSQSLSLSLYFCRILGDIGVNTRRVRRFQRVDNLRRPQNSFESNTLFDIQVVCDNKVTHDKNCAFVCRKWAESTHLNLWWLMKYANGENARTFDGLRCAKTVRISCEWMFLRTSGLRVFTLYIRQSFISIGCISLIAATTTTTTVADVIYIVISSSRCNF